MRLPRIRPRLGLRTTLELVALAAFALSLGRLWRESRPPWPSVRGLRTGAATERVAALRDLCLLGPLAVEATPAVRMAARSDPKPAIRRGAARTLAFLALADAGDTLPVDGLLAGGGTTAPAGPALRPGADASALTLLELAQTDADPTVRAEAIASLRLILVAAVRDRKPMPAPAPVAAAPTLAAGPWVETCVRGLAEQVESTDPVVRGRAIGFLVGSEAAAAVLPEVERFEALAALVAPGAPPLPIELDLLVLDALARQVGPDRPETPAWIDRILGRIARLPAWAPAPVEPGELPGAVERSAYARILWRLVGSAEDVARRPVLGPLLRAGLAGDRARYASNVSRTSWLLGPAMALAAEAPVAARRPLQRTGVEGLPEPRLAAGAALARSPHLLGVLWPGLDPVSRLGWLAEPSYHASRLDALFPSWAERRTRAGLPPADCAAALDRLLDEPEATTDTFEEMTLRTLDISLRGPVTFGERFGPLDRACEVLNVRNIHVLACFARGADPHAPAVERFVARVRGRLGSADPRVRAGLATLLGSLGPAAAPALGDLRRLAGADPDEAVRSAAGDAVATIIPTEPPAAEAPDDDR
jgi:hypothetical protein